MATEYEKKPGDIGKQGDTGKQGDAGKQGGEIGKQGGKPDMPKQDEGLPKEQPKQQP